jgi:hypothetical protein
MQVPATRLLENIIRQEILLLREQDEKTVNLYLDRLKIDYPMVYAELFAKQPSFLNNKTLRVAVYKELSTSADVDIKNVYQSVKKTLEDGGMIPKDINPFKDAIKKSADDKAKKMSPGIPTKSEQQRINSKAAAILGTRGILSDNERKALDLINSIKTQDEYYWVNQYVCDWMRRTGMSAWGYSLPKFLKTFSAKHIMDVDQPFTTALRSIGYMSAVGKSSADGNRKGLKMYMFPAQAIAKLQTEIEWWEKVEKKLNALEALDRDKWQSLKYNVYDPLYTHNIQIETIIDSLSLAKTETKTALEQEKENQKMIGGQPATVNWFKETLDENPAEVLSTMAMVASFASGPAALLFTLGLGAAATGLYLKQGDFAEGGTEAIFTIILTLSGVRRLQSVAKLGQAARVKLAEALAKSDITILNKFERIAFADISNYIAKNSTAVQNGIKSKLQNFINSTGEKVLRQRIVNQLRNQRLTPYKNVVSAIYNDIKNGVIFDVAWWTGKGTRAVFKYGPPGLEIVAYTQAPSGAGYWNDIYANTEIDTEYGRMTMQEYQSIEIESDMITSLADGEFDAEALGVDMDLVGSINFDEDYQE